MRTLITILFLLLFRFSICGQQDMKTGIIYGKDFAYSLTAPNGWILDNKSGVNQGLDAVFYRKGESWDRAETVMYTNTASLEDKANKSLDKLIKYDLDDFKRNYSDIIIVDGKDILIGKNVIAKIKYLSGKSYKNFEAIAYIDAGKTGVMIVISSRTKKGFNNSLIAFEELVKSYFFMTNKVILKNK